MAESRTHFPQARTLAAALAVSLAAPGCMALSPQLPPTDMEAIDKLADRSAREQAYTEQAIYVHKEPQGTRYTKGTDPHAQKRSWQSLDKILRSDKHASQALPVRELRLARLFTALTVAAAIGTVAGTAASAREGLDLKRINGTGGILLGGGIATVAFGITAGFMFGRAKKGYVKAVDVYNDALGMRLGVLTPRGEYVPPRGVLVDAEGFVVLDDAESGAPVPGPVPAAEPSLAPEAAPLEAPAPEAAPAPASSPAPEKTPEAPAPAPVPVQRPGQGSPGGSLALRPRG